MSRLSVNMNAVAFLRNRRDLPWPSVVHLARLALSAGARGVTVHPRPDERHIRRTDVYDLAALLRDEFPDRDLSLEGYPDGDFLELVERVRPAQVLYVPDSPEQSTSDHGWDFQRSHDVLQSVVNETTAWGVVASLFVDPNPDSVQGAVSVGAERIEIFTGPYGACHSDPAQGAAELECVVACAERARDEGLGVNAGHDLTVENLPPLIARAPFIREVSIGHGFTAVALEHGFAEAVKRFRHALGEL